MMPSNASPLNIAILAAGAGGMYCGSCLRDSALATALLRAGQRVTLVPMYTPLKTEDGTVAIDEVFYGGVNVYLQHASALFRHTPRALDWLLDRPGFLRWAGNFGTSTPPAQLGGLTVSILQGEEGHAVKELRRLIHFLKADVKPQIVSLPNLMFVGLARMLRQELGAVVVCELTGEDLFLGQMNAVDRMEAQGIIRERARDVNAFVATSAYYAGAMAKYLGIERERIAVVHPSVPGDYVGGEDRGSRVEDRNPVVGYVARICPEKGFGHLIDAMALLRKLPGMSSATLLAGGYLGAGDRKWFDEAMKAAPSGAMRYVGELDRRAKLELLDSIDVLSVPSVYAEAKGIYVLEALSRGVPVVQPAHGSFPELLEATRGGILTSPGDAQALAEAIASLLSDGPRRAALGSAGRNAIRNGFTDDHMAQKMLTLYRALLDPASAQDTAHREIS